MVYCAIILKRKIMRIKIIMSFVFVLILCNMDMNDKYYKSRYETTFAELPERTQTLLKESFSKKQREKIVLDIADKLNKKPQPFALYIHLEQTGDRLRKPGDKREREISVRELIGNYEDNEDPGIIFVRKFP